jgi:hypothetical protein
MPSFGKLRILHFKSGSRDFSKQNFKSTIDTRTYMTYTLLQKLMKRLVLHVFTTCATRGCPRAKILSSSKVFAASSAVLISSNVYKSTLARLKEVLSRHWGGRQFSLKCISNFFFEDGLRNYRGNLGSLGLFLSNKVLHVWLTFLHLNCL